MRPRDWNYLPGISPEELTGFEPASSEVITLSAQPLSYNSKQRSVSSHIQLSESRGLGWIRTTGLLGCAKMSYHFSTKPSLLPEDMNLDLSCECST